MSRSLYFVVFLCYFGCTLAQGLQGCLQSFRIVYGNEAGSGIFKSVHSACSQLTAFPLFKALASYSGTHTGYGFFAPQVGSSFQLQVSALDSAGRAVAHAGLPLFSNPHNLLRFHSLQNRLQDVQPTHGSAAADRWAMRHARALSHCVAQRLAKRQWGTCYTRLRCTVTVYHHGTLRSPEGADSPQRFIVYQRVIPLQYRS